MLNAVTRLASLYTNQILLTDAVSVDEVYALEELFNSLSNSLHRVCKHILNIKGSKKVSCSDANCRQCGCRMV